MIRRLPPLNALRSFEAAARLGSFHKAAQELYVTPSAVSHQIKTLESFLDIRLFERSKRTVQLTPQGERYLQAITIALDDIDEATHKLMQSPDAGAVNITVAPGFLAYWLMPRVIHFQQLYPDVELKLTASTKQIDFRHSDMDMAIVYGSGPYPESISHPLRRVKITPLCSPKLLQTGGKINKPVDLLKFTLINIAKRDQEWKQFLNDANVKHSERAKSMTFSNTSLAMRAAMEGLGIVLADAKLAERELHFGQLIQPLDLYMDTQQSLDLLYPKGISLTDSMIAFRDWLLDEVQKDQALGFQKPQ